MKIDIKIQKTIEIPDDEVLEVAASVREKWGKGPLEPVHVEDLVNEAMAMNIISAEDAFVLDEDCAATDDELKGMLKKKRRKR